MFSSNHHCIFRTTTLPDLHDTYPDDIAFEELTREECAHAIYSSAPHKASGPTGIPSIAIRWAWQADSDSIYDLLAACVRVSHHPHIWHDAIVATVKWTKSFISDRRVVICNNIQDKMLPVENGIPQGSPVLPVLVIIYSADANYRNHLSTMARSTSHQRTRNTTSRDCQQRTA